MTDPTEPTDASGMPPDPFANSPLLMTANELHLLFTSLLEAGFAESQAVALVQTALATHMQINTVLRQRGLGGG